MLLAIDVGNTHTVLGLYRGETLAASFRLESRRERTADELGILLAGLLAAHGGWGAVDGVALASVVPALEPAFEAACRPRPFLRLTHESRWSFELAVPEPWSVGVDRLVDVEAALAVQAPPLVVVDVGTAIKVEAVEAGPRYRGGAIAPGLETAAEGLFARAARLRPIALRAPEVLVGATTEAALRSGLVHGFAALVEGLVERFRAALGGKAPCLATGGGMHLLAPLVRGIDRFDPELTLKGIRRMAVRHGLVGA